MLNVADILLLNDGLRLGLVNRMFRGSEMSFFEYKSVMLGCVVLPR